MYWKNNKLALAESHDSAAIKYKFQFKGVFIR